MIRIPHKHEHRSTESAGLGCPDAAEGRSRPIHARLYAAQHDWSRGGLVCACGDHFFAKATRGYVIMVSPEDAAILDRPWRATIGGDGYVTIGRSRPYAILAREILGAVPGEIVDHKNGITVDNRRTNLRFCSPTENAANRRKQRGKLLPKGVSMRRDRYRASITHNKRAYNLGCFDTAEAAEQAYLVKARELRGEFERTA